MNAVLLLVSLLGGWTPFDANANSVVKDIIGV